MVLCMSLSSLNFQWRGRQKRRLIRQWKKCLDVEVLEVLEALVSVVLMTSVEHKHSKIGARPPLELSPFAEVECGILPVNLEVEVEVQ